MSIDDLRSRDERLLMTDTIEQRGEAGEVELAQWFRKHRLPFVPVCQARDTFASLFAADVKRPDFFLLIESIGLLAIDAKNKKPTRGELTLDLSKELRRGLMFERLFRVPLWYAYRAAPDDWYWISALKAFEVGVERTGPEGNFLALKLEDFAQLTIGTDVAKLYLQGLAGYGALAKRAADADVSP